MSAFLQDAPPRPAAPGKKWVKVTKAVDGKDFEEWAEVDDVAGPAWGERGALRLIGHDVARIDGPDKVTGRALYPHDVRLPGMVYARLLLCPHPAAKVELDLEPAKQLAGVVDVRALANSENVRFLGQPIAAVAALTPELAEDGLRAIVARYDVQPFAVTREQALADGAAKVTGQGNVREASTSGDESAVQEALAGCDAVVEATYTLPIQHHACLETHGVVVDYRGGEEATVYASTQGTFSVLEGAPQQLDMPAGQITVLVPNMGGGFGAKFGLGIEGGTACRMAKDLKRPVHLMLTRSDEFLMAGNRSGCVQSLRGGASKDGKLVAVHAQVDQLGGLGRGSYGPMPYVYTAQRAFSKRRSVHTNTDASRAFRAPGHPQASFGTECLMDELAYAVGLDPLEFRLRNLPANGGDIWRRQLERAAREIGWYEHENRAKPGSSGFLRTGIGFGISVWGGGGNDQCKVEVRIGRDGAVTVLSGTQDLGTGTRTYVASIVAEELGLPIEAVTARIGSSAYGRANGSGGSTTAASLSPSVKHAAWNARNALFASVAKALGAAPEALQARDGRLHAPGGKSLAWKEACALLGPDGLSAQGVYQAHLSSTGAHGAQAARVAVDTRTGEVRVEKMVCVQDCGLPLNTLTLRSQIQGAMVQALSYGLLEERILDPDLGVMLNAGFEDYKIAGCREIPLMQVFIDDDPRGVLGVGEPPIIPGHAAIANAVYNACGVRVRTLPLSPDKVLMGLWEQSGGKGGNAGGAN